VFNIPEDLKRGYKNLKYYVISPFSVGDAVDKLE
jgi:hypothetical protein